VSPDPDHSQPSWIINSVQPGTSESLEPTHSDLEQPEPGENLTSMPAGPSRVPRVPRANTSTRRLHEDCVVCETAGQCPSHTRPISENTEIWALVPTSLRPTGDDVGEEIPRRRPSSPPFKAAYMAGEELQAAIDESAEKAELEEFNLVSNRSIALMEVKTSQSSLLLLTIIITLFPSAAPL
jgi:hypothetical protein